MTPAAAAIIAAKKAPVWGLYAAMRYAMKHGATFAQFHIAERFETRRNDWQNWVDVKARIKNDFAGYLA